MHSRSDEKRSLTLTYVAFQLSVCVVYNFIIFFYSLIFIFKNIVSLFFLFV